jgi:putative transposase
LYCHVAKVSTSGYYKWLNQADSPDKDHNDYLLVKKVFSGGKGKFGWRSVQMWLKKDHNVIMNHKKIIRIKGKYGMFTKVRRRNPYKAIMKKTQEHRTFDNLLRRQFNQAEPKRVFCTDITYLFYSNHQLAYLSVVKDIATKEVVAWNLSRSLEMSIVLDTIKHLKQNIPVGQLAGVTIHSDQGFHYTNPQYIDQIKQLNMIQSMSRKGNCIDNSPIESFFGHAKDELEYKNLKTFIELKAKVEEYINYYNTQRPQWGIKKMTPVKYRDHLMLNTA